MASQSLLNGQVESGKVTLAACDRGGLDVRAAFWVFEEDSESWRFTMAEASIDFRGTRDLYQRLATVLHGVRDALPIRQIYLMSPNDALPRLVRIAIQTGGNDVAGIMFSGNVINGTRVPDMYIYRMYSPPLSATAP